MVFVGKYNERDLEAGADKVDVEKAKEKTGLKYVQSKIVKEKGTTYLKLWVCTAEEFKI